MDQIESANESTELFMKAALSAIKRTTLTPVGHCYYCDETVQRGVLFCSSECSDDWHKESRVRAINGKS